MKKHILLGCFIFTVVILANYINSKINNGESNYVSLALITFGLGLLGLIAFFAIKNKKKK